MTRLAAFGLVLGIGYVVRHAVPAGAEAQGLAFALGLALIAATLAGEMSEKVRLPRVTGYLLFGLACGPYLANIISRTMARELQVLNGLAVALIALVAGLEIDLSTLRSRLKSLLNYSGVLLGVMYVGLVPLLWAIWPWLPVAPDVHGVPRLAMVAVSAALITSFSPTVTMAVIAESRAAGRFSELMVALVVLADLALIVAFTLAMQFVRWSLGGSEGEEVGIIVRLAWDVVGSLAFGALLGAVFALYLRFVGREVTLVLLALCVILSEAGRHFHFESVLAALSAGLVVQNIAQPQGEALREAVERGALPVLIVFFATAGASLQLDALAAIGLVALLLSAARAGAIWLGTHVATRSSGIDAEHGRLVWMGLIPQAGVTLGLAVIVANEFPEWGRPLETLIVSLIGFHQLVGPVLFRQALVRAGEVGGADRQHAEAQPAPAG